MEWERLGYSYEYKLKLNGSKLDWYDKIDKFMIDKTEVSLHNFTKFPYGNFV